MVAHADLEARVHRAALELPYIHRDIEVEACLHLDAGRPVLLVGPSMVGKTKMAATLIRRMFPTRLAVIPDTREALTSLETADVAVRGAVIFLDDVDRLIGPGGISDGALRRLLAAGNILIATIRATEYDRFQATNQLRPPEWDVLSAFERVFVSRELSGAEQVRLAKSVADAGVRERVKRVGLGEYAGAAEHIAEALHLGPSVSPAGFALVLGAADWRRAGMRGPVPTGVLADLAAPHLSARHRADLSRDQAYRAALDWATRDINPTVALLREAEPDGFVVYDYAVDLLSKQARPIPDATWPILIGRAPQRDLLRIGYSAYGTFDQPEIAREAWRKAADSADAVISPLAALSLGALLTEQGDIDGAVAAYRQAIDSGQAGAAPVAASFLGDLLAERGDVDGAEVAYRQAIDSGHSGAAPRAANGLGVLLAEQGDVEGAQAAYRQAIDSGHASAAVRLGTLLAGQGDLDGAKAAHRRGIDSGDADVAPVAALAFGAISHLQGDLEGAKATYRQAADSAHAKAAARAASLLGDLLAEQGDVEGARAAFQQAIDSGDAEAVPGAALSLGLLLVGQGDVDGAKLAFQRAIDSGDAETAELARWHLAELTE